MVSASAGQVCANILNNIPLISGLVRMAVAKGHLEELKRYEAGLHHFDSNVVNGLMQDFQREIVRGAWMILPGGGALYARYHQGDRIVKQSGEETELDQACCSVFSRTFCETLQGPLSQSLRDKAFLLANQDYSPVVMTNPRRQPVEISPTHFRTTTFPLTLPDRTTTFPLTLPNEEGRGDRVPLNASTESLHSMEEEEV